MGSNGYTAGSTNLGGMGGITAKFISTVFALSLFIWALNWLGLLFIKTVESRPIYALLQAVFAVVLFLLIVALELYSRAHPNEVDTMKAVQIILAFICLLCLVSVGVVLIYIEFPLWIIITAETVLLVFGVLVYIAGDTSSDNIYQT